MSRSSSDFPNVVARVDGKFSLVYLTRFAPENSWQLRACTIEIDPRTNAAANAGPVRIDAAGQGPSRGAPLVVSAKGDSVYAVDNDGQIVETFDPHR